MEGGSSVAIFGEPGSGKFQFVLTGRHCTRRCDGDSVEGAAFGGPLFYGHAAKSADITAGSSRRLRLSNKQRDTADAVIRHHIRPLFLYRAAAGFIGWTPYLSGRALTLGCARAMTAAGFVELSHFYRPPGLPRERQPWLASVWRKPAAPRSD